MSYELKENEKFKCVPCGTLYDDEMSAINCCYEEKVTVVEDEGEEESE